MARLKLTVNEEKTRICKVPGCEMGMKLACINLAGSGLQAAMPQFGSAA